MIVISRKTEISKKEVKTWLPTRKSLRNSLHLYDDQFGLNVYINTNNNMEVQIFNIRKHDWQTKDLRNVEEGWKSLVLVIK